MVYLLFIYCKASNTLLDVKVFQDKFLLDQETKRGDYFYVIKKKEIIK